MLNNQNYEEYFLLYLDGELNAAEQEVVISLLRAHPELQPVFDELKQAYLLPEAALSMPGKKALLQPENQINWQEQMLLSVDQELPASQLARLEKMLNADPVLAGDMFLLQKTILPQEEIIFPDKSLLLREEKGKVRRLSLWFRYIAAAAVVAGILLGLPPVYTSLFAPIPDEVVSTTPATAQPLGGNPDPQGPVLPEKPLILSALPAGQTTAGTAKREVATAAAHRPEATPTPMDKQMVSAGFLQGTTLMVPATENVAQESVMAPLPAVLSVAREIPESQPTTGSEKKVLAGSNLITGKTYQYLDEQEENNRLYLANISFNKNKVKGFLRRTVRILGGARAVAAVAPESSSPEPAPEFK